MLSTFFMTLPLIPATPIRILIDSIGKRERRGHCIGPEAVDANLDFGRDKRCLRVGYKLRDGIEPGAGMPS